MEHIRILGTPATRVDATNLIRVLRQLEVIAKRQAPGIAFKAKGRILFLDLAEIVAVQAEGNYVADYPATRPYMISDQVKSGVSLMSRAIDNLSRAMERASGVCEATDKRLFFQNEHLRFFLPPIQIRRQAPACSRRRDDHQRCGVVRVEIGVATVFRQDMVRPGSECGAEAGGSIRHRYSAQGSRFVLESDPAARCAGFCRTR